jgi:hypothetical protein
MPRSNSSVGVSSAVMTSHEEPVQPTYRGYGTFASHRPAQHQRRHSWHTRPCMQEADNFQLLVCELPPRAEPPSCTELTFIASFATSSLNSTAASTFSKTTATSSMTLVSSMHTTPSSLSANHAPRSPMAPSKQAGDKLPFSSRPWRNGTRMLWSGKRRWERRFWRE